MNKRHTTLLLGLLVLTAQTSFAKKSGGSVTRALPSGFLFPQFQQSALINASSLASEKAKSIGARYRFQRFTGDSHGYDLNFVSGSRNFGMGLGYLGQATSAELTHGAVLGMGVKLEKVSLGLALRDSNLKASVNPHIDFTMDVEIDGGLHLGLGLKDLDAGVSAVLGVGMIKKNKYNLEANLTFPSVNNVDSDNQILSIAAATYVGIFGFSFKTDFFLRSQDLKHRLALGFWLGPHVYLFGSYETAPNLWLVGLSASF